MSAIAIDTLAISKRLTSGGYSQQQAETQAEIWAEIVDEKLTTKTDLSITKAALQADISHARTALETSIRELEYRLTIKLGGMLVVGISIVTALVKLVH